jgi:transposase InsO family protein
MDYVKGCAECQRHKVNNHPTKAALEPIWAKPEATPFETVAVDFITKLPVSQGYDSILTVTDHDCSKATIFIPCVEEISREETAALYAKHVFARYGLPTKIISDRDPRFASKFTRELCKLLGIQQNISTAYHPHTDGQSERSNQWLEQYLRFWVNERQDDWAQYLPLAEFAHNNWTNKSTRESPFQVLMGYHPRADWAGMPSAIPRVTTHLEQYNEARRKAQELMRHAQQSWVRHRDTPKYKTGDQVWLEGRHLQTNQPTAKLAPKCHGPFKVVQVMSPINYRLELPTQWSIYNVFHTDLLTPYREMPSHGANYQHPPPDLVDGVEEYKVEKVLDSRQHGRRRKLQYLITWKGYPDSDNQWVNWDDAEGAEEVIREFKRLNPNREIHIKASIDSPCLASSYSRISSMSTSPTSTCHFTIDTPENCAAWDAVIRSDSYFTPAVTYGDNNNVDDAATYNDYQRGRRSPGIASDILDATTALRDVEEAEAYLPDRTPP